VNVSSTLTNTTIWFVAALSLIVDVRTDGRTFLTGLLGHLLGDNLKRFRRPKKAKIPICREHKYFTLSPRLDEQPLMFTRLQNSRPRPKKARPRPRTRSQYTRPKPIMTKTKITVNKTNFQDQDTCCQQELNLKIISFLRRYNYRYKMASHKIIHYLNLSHET